MSLTGHVTYISGRHAGLPKLTMRVQVKNNFETALAVLSADATVHAKVGTFPGIDETALFLGPATVEVVQNQIGKGSEAQWDIVLPIAHQLLLQKVEQLRGGRDLLLMIHIRASLVVTDPADRTRLGPFMSSTVNSDSHSTAHCVHRVPKSDWLPILKDLGYGDYFLIEVPLRGVPQVADFKRALAHLNSAFEHFSQGLDAEALANCYRCFERFAQDRGAEKPDQNGWDKVLRGIDNRKREKLKHVLSHVATFMHLDRHERGGASLDAGVEHADAEYALILTQASLAYLAKLWPARILPADTSTGISPVAQSKGQVPTSKRRARPPVETT